MLRYLIAAAALSRRFTLRIRRHAGFSPLSMPADAAPLMLIFFAAMPC